VGRSQNHQQFKKLSRNLAAATKGPFKAQTAMMRPVFGAKLKVAHYGETQLQIRRCNSWQLFY
jgi:hypothetical protein